MTFKINNVDILPYIAQGGLEWQRQDLDGANAGRAMNGYMYRDRICTKYRWDVTCRPLTSEELATVLSLIQPEYITCTYTNPLTNSVTTMEAYSNDVPAQFLMLIDGKEYWAGVSFPIIER